MRGQTRGGGASGTKASFIARRIEVCGFVVEKRKRKDSKVMFTVDDGSGCVECVVWTHDGDAASGEQMELFGIASTADGAAAVARDIRVGSLARVQGRVRDWNGRRQINANAVQVDLDPNEELLFWLDVSCEI
jgi:aspartyl/asparaginyl-tRNA synthetase